MSSSTTNYNLTKPAGTDYVDIDDINGNMDAIDATMKQNADGIAALRESVTPERTALNASSTLTRGSMVLTRVGNVVHISGHFFSSSDIAMTTALFETIPSSLRPSYGFAIPGMFTIGDGSVAAYTVVVGADGTVKQGLSAYVRSGFFAGQYLL